MKSMVCAVALVSGSAAANDMLVCGWHSDDVLQCHQGSCETLVEPGAGGLGRPHSITLHTNGDLLVTSIATNNVLRFDRTTGAFEGVFISGGGLLNPTKVAYGPDGNIYVSSFGNNTVRVFDPDGAFVGTRVQPGEGGLSGAESITFGPDDHMYISSRFTNSIKKYHWETGEYLGDFVQPGDGGLDEPFHACFSADGTMLYVSSAESDAVVLYDGATGDLIEVLIADDPETPEIDESGGLDSPHDVTIGPDDLLYVTSWLSDEVLTYELDGTFVGVAAEIDGPLEVVFGTTCDADFNGDGELNVLDFVSFQGAFVAGDPGADCDGDGVLTILDFVCFQQLFGGGC